MLGVFVYDEPMQMSRIFTFIFIWIALAVYSADALSKNRKKLDSRRI
jgi:EamA domain-containing membrane protein RarD